MDESQEPLPYRSVAFRFPKVLDFSDPGYDKHNPAHFVLAKEQRLRESFVANVYMIELREDLRRCALRNGINSRRECHDLGAEYMRRLKCHRYVCPDEAGYLPPIYKPDYRIGYPDDYLELHWQRNAVFDPDQ